MLGVELARTRWTRGFRSRNKAAVGEPAAGSFMFNICIYHLLLYLIIYLLLKLKRVIVDPLA